LEAGSEQHMRIHNHQAEGRRPDGVQHRLLAIEQSRCQVNGQHQRGPPYGRAQPSQQSVRNHKRDGNEARQQISDRQPLKGPERDQGEDGHIHPRDHQHVISTRSLEVRAGGAIDERIFTNYHGVHQGGFARRPQSVDFLDDAAMDSGAPEFRPVAGKTGKHLDAASFGRGQSDDSVVCKVTLVVKRARIAVVAWRRNPGGKTKALPILKQAHGWSACLLLNRTFQLRLIDVYPQAGVDREILVAPGDLFGLDLDPWRTLPGPSSCRIPSLVTWAVTMTSVPSANRGQPELPASSGLRT
jgi:hypothetical protein